MERYSRPRLRRRPAPTCTPFGSASSRRYEAPRRAGRPGPSPPSLLLQGALRVLGPARGGAVLVRCRRSGRGELRRSRDVAVGAVARHDRGGSVRPLHRQRVGAQEVPGRLGARGLAVALRDQAAQDSRQVLVVELREEPVCSELADEPVDVRAGVPGVRVLPAVPVRVRIVLRASSQVAVGDVAHGRLIATPSPGRSDLLVPGDAPKVGARPRSDCTPRRRQLWLRGSGLRRPTLATRRSDPVELGPGRTVEVAALKCQGRTKNPPTHSQLHLDAIARPLASKTGAIRRYVHQRSEASAPSPLRRIKQPLALGRRDIRGPQRGHPPFRSGEPTGTPRADGL